MTIDAMENIPPEEWPLVLANLHRAVRPGGHLYLTVETMDDDRDRCRVRGDSRAKGLPASAARSSKGDTAGYHYYPSREQVLRWLAAEGLRSSTKELDQEDGWGYWHLLLRSRG